MTGEQWDKTMLGLLDELVEYAKEARNGFMRMIACEGMESEAGMIDCTERLFEDMPKKLNTIEYWWDKSSEIEPEEQGE